MQGWAGKRCLKIALLLNKLRIKIDSRVGLIEDAACSYFLPILPCKPNP
jgi:hypothetical protein